MMDPKLDRVGLAVTPPAIGPSDWTIDSKGTQVQVKNPDSPDDACAWDRWRAATTTTASMPGRRGGRPTPSSGYRGQDRAFYVVSSLSDDDIDGNPNDDYVDEGRERHRGPEFELAARLDARVHQVRRQHELLDWRSTRHSTSSTEHGRADVQDVIVFFSDGGANSTQDVAAGYWTDSLSAGWPKKPVPAARASRCPSACRGTRPCTRSATTSRTRRRTPSAARGRARAATRTTASPKRSGQTWGCTPKEALKGDRLEAGELLLHGRRQPAQDALPARRGLRPDERVAPGRQQPPELDYVDY